MQQQKDKVIFANQLRAIAIIAVMISHLCGIYWLARSTVSAYIFAPEIEGPASGLLGWLSPPTVNYGPFGVAIFFLISGFVIPFSLSKLSPIEFLVARVLRIYPTYLIGSAVMLLCIWFSSLYWGKEFSINTNNLLLNLALIHSNIFVKTIDLVNWTLSIEIKFYLISAILYSSIRKANPLPIILLAVGTLCFTEWYPEAKSVIHFTSFNLSIESIKAELMVVCFMFIGTFFYFHFFEKITTLELVLYSSILLLLVLLCWTHNAWASGIPGVPRNYIYGLSMFFTAYALRKHFRLFTPLDFIAKISYPLYITHSLIGYSIMRVAMDNSLPYFAALLIAISIIVAISYTLHITIENKSIEIGKKLIEKIRSKNSKTELEGRQASLSF
jgi:peptidoglycan/LPS O-acetylase OafA/YrhL